MPRPPSLELLMERYVDGDPAAFDALYPLVRGPILGALSRWLPRDRAEDGLQTVLLKLHASRARYTRGAPVLPWVLTIARHVAIDQLRGPTRRERPLEDDAAERLPAPAAEPGLSPEDEAEIAAAVRAAVEELPPSVREIVRRHKLEGVPLKDLAAELGLSEGATRVRAHRGYKALADKLGRWWAARS